MDSESKEQSKAEARAAGKSRAVQAPYTVVARRYRPQRLDDVVGQDHVVRALRNAIRLNRIAQAYLFCGTRGVGKTSMARIFAKCLNCVKGPTEEPCQTCDICQAIALGQDVDVIEIDGASNNGVEQVRELRQNASLRPSRARYKIYYIDEVHMLTTGAFNALLKTLEEPPPHVKFFFATTEAGKIPITVLSRCQRYDFAGITPEVITASLSEICVQERVDAEPEALQVVARRAGGSLRDAQSLLDRLLASGTERLTVEVVHGLLGTASDERLLDLLTALADHDSAAALRLVDQGANEGVQPAELLGGLIEFVRDAMVLANGAETLMLAVTPRQRPRLKQIVQRWTLDSILAALQILGEARARLRGSVHGRLLVEMALVRVAQLQDLVNLNSMVERLSALESGLPPMRQPDSGMAFKKPLPRTAGPTLQPAARPAAPGGGDGESAHPSEVSARIESAAVPAMKAVPPSDTDSSTPAPTSAVEPPELGSRLGTASTSPVEPPTHSVVPAEGGGEKRRSGATRSAAPKGRGSSRPSGTAGNSAGTGTSSPRTGSPLSPEAKATVAAEPPAPELPPLELAEAREVWPDLIKKVGPNLGWRLAQVEPIAAVGSDVLVIAAKPGYNSMAEVCGTPESLLKIGQGLQRLIHRPVNVRYERSSESGEPPPDSRSNGSRRIESVMADPMVQKVMELFDAKLFHTESDDSDNRSLSENEKI
jgi:DNA polymerase-3 subunit gamma/tau